MTIYIKPHVKVKVNKKGEGQDNSGKAGSAGKD